jgi:hypothetical protein
MAVDWARFRPSEVYSKRYLKCRCRCPSPLHRSRCPPSRRCHSPRRRPHRCCRPPRRHVSDKNKMTERK